MYSINSTSFERVTVQYLITVWETDHWIRKNAQAKWQYFPETRHIGESKNEKIEIFCGRPRKLSRFEDKV